MARLIEDLKNRGFIEQTTDQGMDDILARAGTSCYAGFDPSGPSLHIGHLIPVIGLMHFQRAGHRPIALVGGATGMIGDPSGKDEERQLLNIDTLRANEAGIRSQLERFLDFDDPDCGAVVVNNYDWLGKFGYLEFLRQVGKHFSVNAMIAKESVKNRLENRDQGISYTEFSYQLLQAYDFHHLWNEFRCTVQIGGSDQWGNITAGIDLSRRMGGDQLYGVTFPLLMNSDGKKFGKSEGQNVWLDADKTKPYELYQYFIQTDDRDVIKFLKLFTFLSLDEINALESMVQDAPEKREAQNKLASEFTRMTHGETGLKSALAATAILFGGQPIQGFDDEMLSSIFSDIPSKEISRAQLMNGIPVLDLIVETGVCKSKGEARRLVSSGGAYINNIRITDIGKTVTTEDLASETILVIRSGKKRYTLARFQ